MKIHNKNEPKYIGSFFYLIEIDQKND
ncbi:DNA gyrase subunit A [Rhodobacterales bacterium HTCC2255]|nr:DNA gyrase subunit A [Rhodobacterales bacterium HTCC2255]